jgi:Holliday junction DNA helicase RuvB
MALRLPAFTLIGATTDEGALPEALLSRFEHRLHLRFYAVPELAEVIRRAAASEGFDIDDDAAQQLAVVARGTPREALKLYRHARGEALAGQCRRIDGSIVEATLRRLEIDAQGLGPVDRQYLEILRARGSGRPLGLARIAAIMGGSASALERLHEPYLFRLGLVTTTPAGRIALPASAG